MNIRQWADKHRVELVVTERRGTQRDDDGWEHNAYVVKLKWFSPFTERWAEWPGIQYRMGMRLDGDPEAAEVLDSLVIHASSYENAASFENFCSEFGYDTDSRKAHALYMECGEQLKRLREFIGDGRELQRLMYKIERL